MGEKKVTYYQPSKRTIFFLIEDLDEYLAKCKKN